MDLIVKLLIVGLLVMLIFYISLLISKQLVTPDQAPLSEKIYVLPMVAVDSCKGSRI